MTKSVTTTESKPIELPIENIRVVKALYPRLKEDTEAIARYRDSLENLPPIVVARDGVLVDGYHRHQAYKLEGRKTIPAINLGNLTDTEIFEESVRRNAIHGQQLSRDDKKDIVVKLWPRLIHLKDERQSHLSQLLSISERTVRTYAKEAREDEEQEQKDTAKGMWLDCYTQEQIADKVGVAQKTISQLPTTKVVGLHFNLIDPFGSKQSAIGWLTTAL
jgi:hypothetical protein